MGRACIVILILVSLTMAAPAQERPDFSGEWVLNRPDSTLSPGADRMQSAVLRIEHKDPAFRYQAEFVSADGPIRYQYELQTDGSEVQSTDQGITTVSTLRWERDALVTTWRIRRTDSEMIMTWRHELLEDGRRLRAVEQLRGGGREQDNIWIFERR